MEIAVGVAGGIVAEVLKWYRIREELHDGVPDYAKTGLYWIVTGAMVLVGGLLVFLYQNTDAIELNLILVFNIGASAPLLVGATPPIDPGTID